MPKLWNETIEAHRNAVREAILDAAAALVGEQGLRAVTMSELAKRAGIGRATLYKYFPDVEAALHAWHEGHVAGHLIRLVEVEATGNSPAARLEAVLHAYAQIAHERGRHDAELVALLHRGEHAARAREQLRAKIAGLFAEAARVGQARADVAPDELAGFCLHALDGAGRLKSKAAVARLVSLILSGVRSAA